MNKKILNKHVQKLFEYRTKMKNIVTKIKFVNLPDLRKIKLFGFEFK